MKYPGKWILMGLMLLIALYFGYLICESLDYAWRLQQGEVIDGHSIASMYEVHPWSAYLLLIPAVILELPLLAVYIIRYHIDR